MNLCAYSVQGISATTLFLSAASLCFSLSMTQRWGGGQAPEITFSAVLPYKKAPFRGVRNGAFCLKIGGLWGGGGSRVFLKIVCKKLKINGLAQVHRSLFLVQSSLTVLADFPFFRAANHGRRRFFFRLILRFFPKSARVVW